ncbi:MAG: alpha/beta hydrolase [Betaproteobacteria bacterium]|nr:alpha/beta hydrolase [Betaproteobacteria bacterium]
MIEITRITLLLVWLAGSSAHAGDDFFLGLPYGSHAAQRLNLYLPAGQDAAPLLIYVPGGFWGALDERFFKFADGSSKLRFEGAAVAVVRTRSLSGAPWPAPLQDVAAAMALLKREASRYRIDTRRIFLVGHSSGGFIVSRPVFDPDVLRTFGLGTSDIAGVITLSGLHDLGGPARQGQVAEFIGAAFKEPFPSSAILDRPRMRFLILAGERDLDGFARDAQAFALRLHRSGAQVIYQTVPGTNHQSIASLGAEENAISRDLVMDFTGVKPMDESLRLLVDADQHLFFSPPLSSLSFWSQHSDLIRSYPADDRFQEFLFAHILEHRYQLAAMPLKTYHAIPVAELIKTLSGKGRWLRTVNTRNENYYWPLQELIDLDAAIVVGIDDEKDLFRFVVPYRNKREYSWVDRKKPLPSVYRGLGGMLYVRKAPPEHLRLRFSAGMSLTASSFSLAETSPLQAFPNLPESLKPVLTYTNGCLSCHTLRGIGSLAHHNRVEDGAKQGGLGLPLEDYPPRSMETLCLSASARRQHGRRENKPDRRGGARTAVRSGEQGARGTRRPRGGFEMTPPSEPNPPEIA